MPREILVAKMEELQLKHSSLKHDLQRLLDEKEDVIREKEDMKLKVWKILTVVWIFLRPFCWASWIFSDLPFKSSNQTNTKEWHGEFARCWPYN